MFDVIALGDTNVDLIARVCSYPVRGGNAFITSFEKFAGGSAANFAVATSRLELKTGFISKVGNDEYGQIVIEEFKKENVDTSHLLIDEKAHTGWVLVIVDEEGERTFFAYREKCADTQLREEDIDPDYIRTTKLLYVSGVSLASEPSQQAALKAMKIAKNENVKVAFDPNLRLEKWEIPDSFKKPFIKAISLSDLVLIGKEEIMALSGEKTLESSVKNVLNLGPEIVAVKLGSEGSKIFSGSGQEVHCPAFKVKTVDTTGAGDAYNAGFIYGYLKKWDLMKVGTFANAVGAIKVTRKGARSSPTLREVLDFLKNSPLFKI